MGRKRRADPQWSSPPRHKMRLRSSYHYPALLQSLPLMIATRMCHFLDAKSQNTFYQVCRAGKQVVEHHWKTRKRMGLSPVELAPLFPKHQEKVNFRSMFDLCFELRHLAQRLPDGRLREVDFGGVEVVDWNLFQGIIDAEFYEGKTAALMSKVTTLRLDGCTVSSDDLRNAARVLPLVETVSLSQRRVHVYEGRETRREAKGTVKEERERIGRFLKQCFPRLRCVSFT